MKLASNLYLIISLTVVLGGCATAPTRDVMLNANYGPPISKEEFVSKFRNEYGFLDPYSARIACNEPRKAWADYLYNSVYGYLTHCKYNAKNSFGAYVGEKTEAFIISNGQLLLIYPRDWKYLE